MLLEIISVILELLRVFFSHTPGDLVNVVK
jgi:hypothetical protein